MSSISKIFGVTRTIRTLCNRLSTLGIQETTRQSSTFLANFTPIFTIQSNKFSKTAFKCDLMEFFDDKKNWGENEIKHGRSWTKDELRIKSNTDLHKLWFVLLKERNMLLTMEHEYNEKVQYFPSPERLDKVKISMENLEEVVRERNKAYYLLETGETGERPCKYVANQLGYKHYYKACEHVLPKFMNLKWYKTRTIGYNGYAVRKFTRLLNEKRYNEKRKARNRHKNHVVKLMRRYPNLDSEKMKDKYPSVNFEKLKREDKFRGHFVPKVD